MEIVHRMTRKTLLKTPLDSLSGADLRGADLRGADLRGANLSEANLSGADLRGADLREANLREADLRWANLSGADLREADLRWANLREANLSGVSLSGANLSHTNIFGFYAGKHFGFYHESKAYPTGNTLKIGCISHDLAHWRKFVEKIGEEKNYSKKEIAKYKAIIDLIATQDTAEPEE